MSVTLAAGSTLGRYAIRSPIGRGGMGEVYKAWDPSLDRHVALKILPPELVERKDRLQRFIQEAKSASALSHPHIVTIYEIGEAPVDGTPVHFIAMELVEGRTLREEIHGERAPLSRLIELLIQVAEGLAKAHAAGIVHRDLKPENVMIAEERYAKIIDFGLAKLIEPREHLTRQSEVATVQKTRERTVLGTVGYMSPEQVEARPVDHRSDVFSFGCILYEAATRRRPFDGESEIDTLRKIVHEEPPAPPADLPLELSRIIRRCLAKQPDERYQSMRNVSLDLTELVGRPAPGRRFAKARLAAVAAAVLVLFALAGSFVGGLFRSNDPPPVSTAESGSFVAVLPFQVRGSDKIAYLGDGMVDLLSMRLDGVGDLRMVDPRAILARLREEKLETVSPEAAKAIAERFGARTFVLGSVVEAGGRLHVTASLYGRNGDVEATGEASAADESELSRLIDEVAVELAANRAVAGEFAARPSAAETTKSIEALKAYLAGEREFRAERHRAAEDHFAKAVGHDPTFALAWFRLSMSRAWSGDPVPALEANEKALQNLERLGNKDRTLLEGWDAFLRGYADEAERLLRDATTMNPTDVDAWWLLGETHFHHNWLRGRSETEARAAFERGLELDARPAAVGHLADIAMLEDDRPEIARLCRRRAELDPEENYRSHILRCKYMLGNRADAITEAMEAGSAAELMLRTLNERDFVSHQRILDWLTRQTSMQLRHRRGYVAAAHFHAGRGQWSAAREKLARSGELPQEWQALAALLVATPFFTAERSALEETRLRVERWTFEKETASKGPGWTVRGERQRHTRLFLLGLLSAKLGDRNDLRRYVEELRRLPPLSAVHGSSADDMIRTLDALAAVLDGDKMKALAIMQQARFVRVYGLTFPAWTVPSLFLRAELLAANGHYEEALGWYEVLKIARDYEGSFPFATMSRLRAAEMYDRLGRKAEAAREYAIFAEIWQDCDPELRPMLDRARSRAASLRQEIGG